MSGTAAPRDHEAEQAVLGAILLGGKIPTSVTDAGLGAGDFYSAQHATVYAACVELHDRGAGIDTTTLCAQLNGRLNRAGGRATIDRLAGAVPAVGHVGEYARIVIECARRRDERRAALHFADNPADPAARDALANALARPQAAHGASSTWQPLDLAEVIDGGRIGEPPSLLRRADGIALLYASKVHALSGEPEAGKGWLALLATKERLDAGEHVLYLDFEDSADTIVSRLLALGTSRQAIVEHLTYTRPDEPLEGPARAALEHALTDPPTLAVIDGITEALAIHGLDLSDNGDVARWLTLLPRPLAATGAAVLQVDHVVKDKDARGRYAIGAQHKLAGVDVAYTLDPIEPFGRGRIGHSRLTVRKDRPGHVRQHGDTAQRVADLRLAADDTGAVTATLTPPRGDTPPAFRPTILMERISRELEAHPGLGKRAIRDTVRGKNDAKDLALELLVADGHVRIDADGQALHHHVERPYREHDDPHRAPVPQPCPDRAPGTGARDRAPVPPPLRARGTRHTPPDTPQPAPTVPPAEVPT